MVYKIGYRELASSINPIAFAKYLRDTGWVQFDTNRRDIRIFQKETNSFYQVTIPMEDSLADYKEALYEACKRVAECEGRSLEQLYLYLLNPNADILKIRIKKEIEPGSILLDDAIGVYENAKKLLGAAAQDVLKPAQIHQGRMETAIVDFLSNCRFGQTEVGSYIVSVICPMTEVKEGKIRQLELFEDGNDAATNFTRMVTTKVVKSIQKVKDHIDDGKYNLSETSVEDEISANFYEALLGINLDQEGIKVDFVPEWAPGLPISEKLPEKISLSHNYYQPIHSSVTRMKGNIKRELFLLYLKPIINGTGNYYIEAQTRDQTRTDVIVDYLGQQFVLELKIWRGPRYNEEGEKQISEYLEYFGLTTGYMLSFNFNKKKETGLKRVEVGGKVLFECTV